MMQSDYLLASLFKLLSFCLISSLFQDECFFDWSSAMKLLQQVLPCSLSEPVLKSCRLCNGGHAASKSGVRCTYNQCAQALVFATQILRFVTLTTGSLAFISFTPNSQIHWLFFNRSLPHLY